ncbi:PspA/IM30 family protein [Caldalkalibacillus mannanilyticus]|uniref:PspA/IM30 family protein n=1 Tax=Caldalkalibacillus mannanilyticus TaxID=1418 RepID=UPI000468CCA0|nr:PspA/IM30 family protein [Caldalkalibacillus mannanilyticus]
MSIFSRIKNAISADFHEVLDQKEQKNPIALLNHYLRQSEQEVEKVRKLVERQYRLKEEFTREHRKAQELAERRAKQAEVASKAGEMELHHYIVEEQAQQEQRAARLKDSLQQASQQLTALERKYDEMKNKLKDMYIKRMELMGRENIARAQHRMNQVLDTVDETNHFSKFEEIENYLERVEHQVNSSYYRNTIDSRIAQLEKEIQKGESHSLS